MVDIAVIGGGPAGLSAAINACARGKQVLVISNPIEENPLYKAPEVDNYPGLPNISGADLLRTLEEHARKKGAQFRVGRVQKVLPMGDCFFIGVGSDVVESRALILAIGAQRGAKLPGEDALLGRGVSWCATCDGMLYRGKDAVVIGLSHDAPAETNFLHEIGCKVTYVARKVPDGLNGSIPVVVGKQFSIEGETAVTGVNVDGTTIPCQGAFILREAMAPGDLLPGLDPINDFIPVQRNMRTGVRGVFACGDCIGLPFQVAKAVGEGLFAGLSAAEFLASEI